MESFENTSFNLDKNKKEGGILLEDELKKNDFENFDSVPYPLLIHKIEKEIISLREERGESDEDYREKILSRKGEFVEKLKDENRIHLANILFGAEELILRDKIEKENGKRTVNMIIEDVKFQQEMAYFITDNENDSNLLEDYWDLYDDLFKVNGNETVAKGEKIKHGVLAPIALKNILDKKYNKNQAISRLDIIYSTPEDDAMRSIDIIAIDNERKINLLIQVKGDAMSWEELDERVKPKTKSNGGVNNKEEVKDLIYIFDEKDFADDDTSIKEKKGGEKLNKFNSGCASYVKEHGDVLKEKGFKTLGVYIYIPSIVDGDPMIDINGKPDKKLYNFISEFLELKISELANK